MCGTYVTPTYAFFLFHYFNYTWIFCSQRPLHHLERLPLTDCTDLYTRIGILDSPSLSVSSDTTPYSSTLRKKNRLPKWTSLKRKKSSVRSHLPCVSLSSPPLLLSSLLSSFASCSRLRSLHLGVVLVISTTTTKGGGGRGRELAHRAGGLDGAGQ